MSASDEVGGGGVGELAEAVHALVVGQADVGGRAVDEEHVLEVGRQVERPGDALEALLVGDEHLGAGVLEAVLDLVGGPPPVEADEDGALLDGGPEREAPLGVVLAEHRDPVALLQAELVAQRVGHAVGGVDERAEAVGAVAVDEEGLVVAPHAAHLGHRPERRHPALVHLRRSPEDLLGDDLEHPPGPVSWAFTSAAVGMDRDRIASACRRISRTSTIRDMRMSDAVEWSIHCCTLLAALPEDQALPAARLAEYHDVPPAYLAKALQAMAAAGIVESRPGRPAATGSPASPTDITLLDVVQAVDGPGTAFRCSEIRQRGPGAIDEPGAYRTPVRHRPGDVAGRGRLAGRARRRRRSATWSSTSSRTPRRHGCRRGLEWIQDVHVQRRSRT